MQKWDSVLFLLCYIPGTFEPLEADWKHSAAEVPCVKTKAPMTPNVDKGPTYPVAAPELVNFLAGRRGFCALSRTCQVKRKKVGGAFEVWTVWRVPAGSPASLQALILFCPNLYQGKFRTTKKEFSS